MGLLTGLLTLPISGPVNGAVWVLRKIAETAEAELNDPVAIRRSLEELEEKLEAGEIDEDSFEEAEAVLLNRLEKAPR